MIIIQVEVEEQGPHISWKMHSETNATSTPREADVVREFNEMMLLHIHGKPNGKALFIERKNPEA